MRPSFEAASSIFDWANWFLIAALALGVVSTGLVVWSGKIKEEYLTRDLASARSDAAHAVLQTTILSKETADANERAAKAEQKAAEANLEIARLKMPRQLSDDQKGNITKYLGKYGAIPFVVTVFNDPEAINLLTQIENALASAGWVQNRWDGAINFERSGKPAVGLNSLSGLFVQIDRSRPELLSAGQALTNALNIEGLPTKIEVGDLQPPMNKGLVQIQIGKKPQ